MKLDPTLADVPAHATLLGGFINLALLETLRYLISIRDPNRKVNFHAVAFEIVGLRLCRMAFGKDIRIRGWVAIDKPVPPDKQYVEKPTDEELKELREKGIYPWFEGEVTSKMIKRARDLCACALPGVISVIEEERPKIGVKIDWYDNRKKQITLAARQRDSRNTAVRHARQSFLRAWKA